MKTRILIVLSILLIVAGACAQTYPPAWKSTSSYSVGDQVQLNGNVLRATHPVAPGGFKYDDWELWEVRANTTLMIGVGQTFASLTTAWAYAQNARIASSAYLHLYISTQHGASVEYFATPFSLDHPFGASMSLIGQDRNNVVLNSTEGFTLGNGLTIDSGHVFGSITGITVSGTGISNQASGILATGNSLIGDISNTTISAFGTGIFADYGAQVGLEGSTSVTDARNYALEAMRAGRIFMVAGGFTCNTGGTAVIYADLGGVIEAAGSTISNPSSIAVQSFDNAVVDISYSHITGATIGAQAEDKGEVYALYAYFANNSPYDMQALNGGFIEASSLANASSAQTSLDVGRGSYIYLP